MRGKIIGVSVAVILSLAAILLVSTVPYFILDDIPIEIKEGTSQKTVRTLTPTETILVPETHTSETKEFKSSSIVEKISEPSLSAQSFPFEAHAIIGSTVNQINFLKYTPGNVPSTQNQAFDSNHNLLTIRGIEVFFIDRGTLTKTIWTIPNSGIMLGGAAAVDSAGNMYFGQQDNIMTKLVPSTDTFIQVSFGQPATLFYQKIEISSSGEVFFRTNSDVGKVNFDTGEVKLWTQPIGPKDLLLDSNDNMYYNELDGAGQKLHRLNPTTNVLTTWFIDSAKDRPSGMGIDNNDNLYIYVDGTNAKIQKIDTTTNVLEEWVVPITFAVNPNRIAVDSAGTVYFLDALTRLVPSTGKFTTWDVTGRNSLKNIVVDSNDDLWISGSGVFGKITAP